MELMASDSSEELVLSIQEESIQMYRKPSASATAHARLTFSESEGSVRIVEWEIEDEAVKR